MMTPLLLLTIIIAAAATTKAAPMSTNATHCVTSCDGLRNGDYQSCHGCHVYVTCFHGNMNDDRPCPRSTEWDDAAKRCLYKSTTCTATGAEGAVPQRLVAGVSVTAQGNDRWCLKSCEGRMDGNYPSCKGLKFYASCSGGVMYDARPCAPGTEWDNWNKICNHVPARDVTTVCVTSCQGRPDGNYQSCHGCHVFASCSGGQLIDNRPCPDNNLQWDDKRKDCVYTSSTCPTTNHLTSGSTSGFAAKIGDLRCVSSCVGLPDGDYQSCRGCHYYLSCSNGRMYDRRSCPGRLVWDDIIKRCSWGSRTCQGGHDLEQGRCVGDCVGVEDGDYQSCLGCTVYATCSNGIMSDNRPCPSGLVWDDVNRQCRVTSHTCDVTSTTTTTPTTTPRYTTTVPTTSRTKGNVTVPSGTNPPRP